MADDGVTRPPCNRAFGAILGTASLCALFPIGISFFPQRIIKKIFPSIVTGTTLTLMGVSLIQSGFVNWLWV
jgi:xanthine/uracil permease